MIEDNKKSLTNHELEFALAVRWLEVSKYAWSDRTRSPSTRIACNKTLVSRKAISKLSGPSIAGGEF
jgi:hypothetical protein